MRTLIRLKPVYSGQPKTAHCKLLLDAALEPKCAEKKK